MLFMLDARVRETVSRCAGGGAGWRAGPGAKRAESGCAQGTHARPQRTAVRAGVWVGGRRKRGPARRRHRRKPPHNKTRTAATCKEQAGISTDLSGRGNTASASRCQSPATQTVAVSARAKLTTRGAHARHLRARKGEPRNRAGRPARRTGAPLRSVARGMQGAPLLCGPTQRCGRARSITDEWPTRERDSGLHHSSRPCQLHRSRGRNAPAARSGPSLRSPRRSRHPAPGACPSSARYVDKADCESEHELRPRGRADGLPRPVTAQPLASLRFRRVPRAVVGHSCTGMR